MSKKSQWQNNLEQIFLIDNGAYEIKFSTAHPKSQIRRMQNAKFIERNFNYENKFFIEEIDSYGINNISNIKNNFTRPLKRGLLYNIDTQIEIWEDALKKLSNYDKYKDNMLIFTHTPFCPDKVIETYLEVIFEYFNFDSCIKSLPHLFTSIYSQKLFPDINQNLQLVIDSGFSSTTIVPIFNSMPIYNGIKRVDIGGKLLTNFLKESLNNLIEIDLRKDFFLVNSIKEELCYISDDFNGDMRLASYKDERNTIKKPFVLPEYRNKPDEFYQKMPKEKYMIEMNNLRFIVPELIFNPNLIGIEEGGLHEGVVQSINCCNKDYNNLLYKNIILSGGNINFKGFKDKLRKEIIPFSDIDSEVRTYEFEGKDRTFNVIKGMKSFAANEEILKNCAMTKNEYDELGFNILWKQYL